MSSEAPAQQADAATDEPSSGPARRRDDGRRWRRGAWRGAWLALLLGWAGLGLWHATKPLAPGVHLASAWTPVAASDLRLLVDLTTADAFGQPVVQQQIFDETLRVIGGARRFVVLDQFLFNALQGATAAGTGAGAAAAAGSATQGTPPVGEANRAPLRPLSRELTEALLAAKRTHPGLRILFVTDPINDVYGGAPSPELARLESAGIEVVRTDLDALRDSNPGWSGFWRLAIHWWDGDGRGDGWLPNPLETGPSRVTFRAWARLLNFKANHRKVVIADDGAADGELVGIVGSANPHDASSAHSNLALELRGEALRPLLESELAVARFSGWRGEALPQTRPVPVPAPAPASGAAGKAAAARDILRVRVLTEGAIEAALLEQLGATRAGDHVDIATFYLSDRDFVEALLAAARRGADVRLLLDPNKDAFGHAKSGIPNRPAASELVSRSDGAIKVRWYRTHGEQFHVKLVRVQAGDTTWLTLGSANLTRRNLGDYNLEANLAVEAPASAPIAQETARWFETLWSNRAPAGIEYTADFGTFADPAQTSLWAYRIMEATGLSTF